MVGLSSKKVYFLLVIMIALIGSGCLRNSRITPTDTSTLLVHAIVPPILQQDQVTTQSILEELVLQSVVFTITDGTTLLTETIDVSVKQTKVEASFRKLAVGTWDIQVTAIDSDGYTIATGATSTQIKIGAQTTSEVLLSILPGELELILSFLDEDPAESGKLMVLDPTTASYSSWLFDVMPGTDLRMELGEQIARVCTIRVELYDYRGDILNIAEVHIPVLPGRLTSGEVVFDEYPSENLQIEVGWKLPPKKPVNVTAFYSNGTVVINWVGSQDAIGYRVLRSTTETEYGRLIQDDLFQTTTIVDTYSFDADQVYWYRVVAIGDDGLSSQFSDPISVVANDEAETVVITLDVEGNGTVEPTVGTYTFEKDMEILITAYPAPGSIFSHWVGIVVDADKEATFMQTEADQIVKAVFIDQLTATVTVEHLQVGPAHMLTVWVTASNVPHSVGFWIERPEEGGSNLFGEVQYSVTSEEFLPLHIVDASDNILASVNLPMDSIEDRVVFITACRGK